MVMKVTSKMWVCVPCKTSTTGDMFYFCIIGVCIPLYKILITAAFAPFGTVQGGFVFQIVLEIIGSE